MSTIHANSVTEAWKQVVQACLENRGREIVALTVEIKSEDQPDDPCFRRELNDVLKRSGKATVETVSRTIFPSGLWNPAKPRSDLLARYNRILPKLRKCRLNQRGIYFERLVRYPLQKRGKAFKNQLEFIINTFVTKKNHRRSALQASIYHPFLDASDSPRLGFPCLQQLAFVPTQSGMLTVIAFYPLHYIFERAYGNYLGLAQLGKFMAAEMGLRYDRLICVAGVAKLEVPAGKLRPLNLSRIEGR
jgi:hypothetical protein